MAGSDKVEFLGLGITEACSIVGVSETHLRMWIDRHGLFRNMKRGSGYRYSFNLSDLFTLAGVNILIGVGLTQRAACEALSPYTLYGHFLHAWPRSFVLSRNKDGRWVGVDGPDIPATIDIKPAAVWQMLRPGVLKVVGEAALARYEGKLAEHRALQKSLVS